MMNTTSPKAVLRAYVGESDKLDHLPLFKAIVKQAREQGMAGATVLKGVLAFGASSQMRTADRLDLSADLSLVVEVVDDLEKVSDFKQVVAELFDRAGCGGLVTIQSVDEAIQFKPR
jgi:PII-like signaling protein